ncbi:DUF2783 domain-containing protein [Mesorhizobium koreense]|jgi:hypothetical protein|uniref:DUF2783 domain-containing protein n=1 Tax=Mesorhizobium koreense TaxID=3074855 RepID=UPI00287B93B1|nr:DUF2783 domain-containing protein [Mesorhizobium sp. WR6]
MSDKQEIGRDRLGPRGDEFYAALMAAHEGLSFEESAALNARLVLVLANLVGDPRSLEQALAAVQKRAS